MKQNPLTESGNWSAVHPVVRGLERLRSVIVQPLERKNSVLSLKGILVLI